MSFPSGTPGFSAFSFARLGLFGKELFKVEGLRIGKGSKIIANKIIICEPGKSERV
jgi:hypothetical protein